MSVSVGRFSANSCEQLYDIQGCKQLAFIPWLVYEVGDCGFYCLV